jgi:hypothetical protein
MWKELAAVSEREQDKKNGKYTRKNNMKVV